MGSAAGSSLPRVSPLQEPAPGLGLTQGSLPTPRAPEDRERLPRHQGEPGVCRTFSEPQAQSRAVCPKVRGVPRTLLLHFCGGLQGAVLTCVPTADSEGARPPRLRQSWFEKS